MNKYERIKTFCFGALTTFLFFYACYPPYPSTHSPATGNVALAQDQGLSWRVKEIEDVLFGQWSSSQYSSLYGLKQTGLIKEFEAAQDKVEEVERKLRSVEWNISLGSSSESYRVTDNEDAIAVNQNDISTLYVRVLRAENLAVQIAQWVDTAFVKK